LIIALFTSRYSHHTSAPREHAIAVRAAALADMGHAVHVVTTPSAELPVGFHSDRKVTVHRLPAQCGLDTDQFCVACDEWCRKFEPDVVHIDDPIVKRPWWTGIKAIKAATIHRSAFAKWVESTNMLRCGLASKSGYSVRDGFDEGLALRRTFAVTMFPSRWDEWVYQSLAGVDNSKVVYQPLSLDCYSADCDMRKSHWLAVNEPGETAPADGVRLAERAADKAGVAIQSVTRSNTTGQVVVYDESVGVVLPSFTAHLPYALGEALARRRPVIATTIGAVAFEHLDGVTMVSAGDIDAMAEAMGNPPEVPVDAANRWHPRKHAIDWLEAVTK
jgi:hypothetical protein